MTLLPFEREHHLIYSYINSFVGLWKDNFIESRIEKFNYWLNLLELVRVRWYRRWKNLFFHHLRGLICFRQSWCILNFIIVIRFFTMICIFSFTVWFNYYFFILTVWFSYLLFSFTFYVLKCYILIICPIVIFKISGITISR